MYICPRYASTFKYIYRISIIYKQLWSNLLILNWNNDKINIQVYVYKPFDAY